VSIVNNYGSSSSAVISMSYAFRSFQIPRIESLCKDEFPWVEFHTRVDILKRMKRGHSVAIAPGVSRDILLFMNHDFDAFPFLF
jgi:hypothetical protein